MVGADPLAIGGLGRTARIRLPGGRVFDAIFALFLNAACHGRVAAG